MSAWVAVREVVAPLVSGSDILRYSLIFTLLLPPYHRVATLLRDNANLRCHFARSRSSYDHEDQRTSLFRRFDEPGYFQPRLFKFPENPNRFERDLKFETFLKSSIFD